jgi:hypothetical protein
MAGQNGEASYDATLILSRLGLRLDALSLSAV